MKKQIALILGLWIASMISLQAQNVAFYEPDEVLNALPEYQKAVKEIDEQVKKWQAEIKEKFKEAEKKYQYLIKHESGLTEQEKKKIQEDIIELEKSAKKYKEEIFGKDGKLAKLEEKKLQPIYDQLDQVIDEVVERLEIDMLFIKTPTSDLIRAKDNYNITNDIKSGFGIK